MMRAISKYIKRITAFVAVILFFIPSVHAQTDTLKFWDKANEYHPKRGNVIIISSAVAYSGGMYGLYNLWYKQYPQSSFHFFNDTKEWMQMDKLGHVGSAYYIARWSGDVLKWSGVKNKKSAIIGTAVGYGFQLSIEVMDGFSKQWGFSAGDLTANTIGAGLYLSQELLWKEQRITYKISYHDTKYPQYNPNLLGSNFQEQLLKDYNGQTYWLSTNIKSFLNKESKFPSWLNMAVGIGAEGMVGAEVNLNEYNGKAVPNFYRQRYFYLSPDIDITRIKTKWGAVNALKKVFGFIKVPAPALRLSQDGELKGYAVFF
jgi:hypothetical protein